MSLIDTRFDQMFPVLDRAQIDTAKRFASGTAQQFAAGATLYDVGQRNVPAWLVLEGSVEVVRRDGLHRESSVVSLEPGQFSGEVSQLASRGTLAAGRAGPQGCTALPFDAAHIRALVIGSADVGEILMRAFILRRVGLIQEGGAGSLLIGRPGDPDLLRLEGFLSRTPIPTPCSMRDRRSRPRRDRALRRAAERIAADDLPTRRDVAASDRRRGPRCVPASRRSLILTTVYDVAVVGVVRRDWRPRSMALPRGFRCW
ncbi:MAG: hypothetical protein WDN48_08305 [Pseudolabrys sp.]